MGPEIACQSLGPTPAEDTAVMFQEATDLKADYLVVPYHSCSGFRKYVAAVIYM
jgi:hypothetical protein